MNAQPLYFILTLLSSSGATLCLHAVSHSKAKGMEHVLVDSYADDPHVPVPWFLSWYVVCCAFFFRISEARLFCFPPPPLFPIACS